MINSEHWTNSVSEYEEVFSLVTLVVLVVEFTADQMSCWINDSPSLC